MEIGIISDIHADLENLEKALSLLKAHGLEQIICAGDLVDRGGDADAVIARLQAEQIPVVMGNHDFIARKTQTHCLKYPERYPDYKLLSEASLNYLEKLPLVQHFEWAGKRLCLAHATPWHLDTYVYHRKPPQLFLRVLEEAKADIVILGHTHVPMAIEVLGKGWIFNAGSSYSNYPINFDAPEKRQGSCGILSLPDCNFMVYELDTGQAYPIARTKVNPN